MFIYIYIYRYSPQELRSTRRRNVARRTPLVTVLASEFSPDSKCLIIAVGRASDHPRRGVYSFREITARVRSSGIFHCNPEIIKAVAAD